MASAGEVKVNISGESKELIRALKESAKAFSKFAQKIEKDAEESAKKITQSYTNAFKNIDKKTGARTRYRAKGSRGMPARATSPRFGASAMQTMQMGRGDPFSKATADFSKGFGKGISGIVSKLGPLAMGFAAAGAALDGLRAGLVASVQAAREFEAGFSIVRAITSGSAVDFESLEHAIVKVSVSTEHTTNSLLKAAEVFGRAGFKAEEIGQALKTTADLATAAGMDIGKSANLSVRMLKSYGLSMKELPRIANMLAHASASANVNIQSLGKGFKFAGAIAQTVGLSFADVTTALALLGETGLEAGLAGRALQAMIMDLANPTTRAKKKLYELGIITHDAAGDMLPMKVILEQLNEAGADANDIFTIFNRNSARAVTALGRNIDKYGDFTDGVETANEALDKQSKIIRDNYDFALKNLSNKVSEFAKNLGDLLIPMLNIIVNKLGKWVKIANFLLFEMFGDDPPAPKPADDSPMGPSTEDAGPAMKAYDEALRKKQGEEKRAAEIAKALDPNEIMKTALVEFKQSWELAQIHGKKAVEGFDIGGSLKGLMTTAFKKLKSSELPEKYSDQMFEAVKEAFRKIQESAQVGAAEQVQANLKHKAELKAALERARALETETVREIIEGIEIRRQARAATIDLEADMFEAEMRALDELTEGKGVQWRKIGGILDVVWEEIKGGLLKIGGFFGGVAGAAVGASDLGPLVEDVSAAAAQGPMAMALAAFTNLMMSTEGFKAVLVPLNLIFQQLVSVIEPFMKPLFMVAEAFAQISGMLINFFLPIIEAVAWAIEKVVSGILWVVNKVIDLINLIPGVDIDNIEIGDKYEETMASLRDETDKTKDGFKDLNEELAKSGNIPAGFKKNLRAFQAALGGTVDAARDIMGVDGGAGGPSGGAGGYGTSGSGPGAQKKRYQHGGIVPGVGFGDSVPALLSPGEQVIPRGGTAGGVVIQNMVVQVADTKDFMRKLTREQEWNSMVRKGSPLQGKLSGAR